MHSLAVETLQNGDRYFEDTEAPSESKNTACCTILKPYWVRDRITLDSLDALNDQLEDFQTDYIGEARAVERFEKAVDKIFAFQGGH